MPLLQYSYFSIPGLVIRRPMAPVVAINTLNGRSAEFIGILDTGADQTTLSARLLSDLAIDPDALPESEIGGAEGVAPALYCDFIRLAFLEYPGLRRHFPNGALPVPAHFAKGPFCLLGREALLNRCSIAFDGPKQIVTIDL